MSLQLLEIVLILGLIAWQGYTFFLNRSLIQRVQGMYPDVAQLGVEAVEVTENEFSSLPPKERILQGHSSFTWAFYPGQEFAIMQRPGDGTVQVSKWNSTANQWEIFNQQPESAVLQFINAGDFQLAHDLTNRTAFDALTVARPSPEFARIVTDTNDYLQANKGAAADFNTLRDISERETALLDQEIEAQLSTPLYLGLLGTFLGAILGLIALVNPFGAAPTAEASATGASSFNNADVTHFLGGILIAMSGSFTGLLLTLAGNQLLKSARATRDRLKNGYYNFLQKALLPRLNTDMQNSMSSLRAVLDTFNQDFFSKIQVDFFAKIAEFTPLISRITENISIQKDFLEKLQTIGYTELANATIKVFDRVDESAASFEKFLGYQQALNVAVSQGADTARTITALLDRLGSLEKALNQVPGYLAQHDARIREQAQFFGEHQALLAKISQGVGQALSEDAAQMNQVLARRREEFEQEAQAAHAQWSAHFRQLNQDNVYQKIVEYLSPFQQLPAQQQALNQLQETQARHSAEALQALQQPLEQNRRIQEELLRQTERTNAVLEKLTQRNWLQRMVG
ncbi:hypothetical protein [Hymenobacter sp. BRD67]|uniref:hypothetical protein n=1 Tax=Hymenobacter sp. BRD67 TaxID=2675877 RepID=UPI001564E73F|nr:hypothetical protein [Hymenobacter sp. BRD67]QKG53886.1 hypothetical protein GKZ67_16355 [Hymenobacter sp. BRD67]